MNYLIIQFNTLFLVFSRKNFLTQKLLLKNDPVLHLEPRMTTALVPTQYDNSCSSLRETQTKYRISTDKADSPEHYHILLGSCTRLPEHYIDIITLQSGNILQFIKTVMKVLNNQWRLCGVRFILRREKDNISLCLCWN